MRITLYTLFETEFLLLNLPTQFGEDPQFIYAWKLTLANGTAYPYAFVRADTPALIYYFNGVIID